MNIALASKASHLPPKTIRYYEDIGLILPGRLRNGYRDYGETDVHKLRFLQRARSLGFTIEECRKLLSLYEDENRISRDVKRIAHQHLEKIERKIRELNSMQAVLRELVEHCHGDERPNCPILERLSGSAEAKAGMGNANTDKAISKQG